MCEDQWYSCSGNKLPEPYKFIEIRTAYGSGDNNIVTGYLFKLTMSSTLLQSAEHYANPQMYTNIIWYRGRANSLDTEILNPICWRYV